MPLSPEQRAAYGRGWAAFSSEIRFVRANGQCECRGECGSPRHPTADGRCLARHGEPSPLTGSRVVLTTAHLDHEPASRDPERVRAMCQCCHLAYDQPRHTWSRRRHAAEARLGMEPLEGT